MTPGGPRAQFGQCLHVCGRRWKLCDDFRVGGLVQEAGRERKLGELLQ